MILVSRVRPFDASCAAVVPKVATGPASKHDYLGEVAESAFCNSGPKTGNDVWSNRRP